ncbi:hypothetical protein GCM10007380_09340 [Gottfriedia solisilvae]|uniref:Uncharacterized protein n=1 Tax=Gottfriedia solisilvae TaxID=1516104 RepID=A0A8J3AFP1_9BACI|nr:hypothetical protein GCM10007380_09340 [Gottfriedia solisilvae]
MLILAQEANPILIYLALIAPIIGIVLFLLAIVIIVWIAIIR